MCTIGTKNIKSKLNHLEKEMPTAGKMFYDFGKYIAHELEREITPLDFAATVEIALYNLQHGIGTKNDYTPERLVKQPEFFYRILRWHMPKIVYVTFPEDFARRVIQILKVQNDILITLGKGTRKFSANI